MGIGRGEEKREREREIGDMGQGTRERADVVGIGDYPKVLCSNGSQAHCPKTASILNESLPRSPSLFLHNSAEKGASDGDAFE